MVEKIKKHHSDFNFTTDVIVGFPGETEEDFDATCEMVHKVGFSHVHTFPYSVRYHTRAARMTDQVPERIKTQRSKVIREIAEENKRLYRQSFIGREQIVLTEKVRGKHATGYGQHYIPIEIMGNNLQANTFYKVRIIGIKENKELVLVGEDRGLS